MRKLVAVRIVHAPSDMGSASAGLEKAGISTLGRQRWQENQKKIESFWLELEKEVEDLGLDVEKLRIYQDGLPCAGALGSESCGRRQPKAAGTTRLCKSSWTGALRLRRRKASICSGKSTATSKPFWRPKRMKRDMGRKRDTIRSKISCWRSGIYSSPGQLMPLLKEGETGLLFIGASHNVLPKIAGDIEVKCLD